MHRLVDRARCRPWQSMLLGRLGMPFVQHFLAWATRSNEDERSPLSPVTHAAMEGPTTRAHFANRVCLTGASYAEDAIDARFDEQESAQDLSAEGLSGPSAHQSGALCDS